jgi:hypothetical protein
VRRKQKALVDVIAERLSSHQEAVLDNIKWYPDEPYRSWNLKQSLKSHTRRTVEAILGHLRSVEVEERAELEQELFEEVRSSVGRRR